MNAWTVFIKELIDGLRDQRAVISALVTPVMGPVMLAFMVAFIADVSSELDELELVVVGHKDAPALTDFLQEQGVTLAAAPEDPEAAVEAGDLDVVVRIGEGFQADLAKGRPATVEIIVDKSDKRANAKRQHAARLLRGYAAQLASLRMIARGVHPELARPLEIKEVDVATRKEVAAANLLGIIPLFLLMAAFIGGLAFAIDTTAGERERRSLEPLLLTPPTRRAIVVGKWLATCAFSGLGVVISIVGFYVAVRLAPVERLDFVLKLDVTTALLMTLAMVPATLMAAALMMVAASFSRSFKEAQSSATVLILIPVLPGIVGVLYGVGDSLERALVPFLGQQMVLTALLSGEQPLAAIGLSGIAGLVVAGLALWFTARRFERESMLS